MTAKGRQRPSYTSHFRASSPSCHDQVGQRGPWEWGIQFLCDIPTIPRPNWGRTATITSSEKPTMAESQSWLQRRHCQSLTQLSRAGLFRELLVNSVQFSSVQFSSVTQSCLTLCNPMNCSMPGLLVHHQLTESSQTHVHRVDDAIQPSHPLLSPSPPILNLSQHQGLFKWVSSSHQVAKVLKFQLQHQSFQRTPRTDLL